MKPWAEVQKLSMEEVVAEFDKIAGQTVNNLNFWAAEVSRRMQERQSSGMLRLTKWIAVMTVVMTVATIVNVILFALS